MPPMASARIQQWALTLSAYDYTISYKSGKDQANADFLSGLQLAGFPKETPTLGHIILLMECLQTSPTSFNHIKSRTSRDPLLSKVRKISLQGWQVSNDEALRPFQQLIR